MTPGRSRGKMSKDIRRLSAQHRQNVADIGNLCSDFCDGKISDEQFKERLSTLIIKWKPICGRVTYQNVGLALRAWIIEKKFKPADQVDKDELWQLAHQVEPNPGLP